MGRHALRGLRTCSSQKTLCYMLHLSGGLQNCSDLCDLQQFLRVNKVRSWVPKYLGYHNENKTTIIDWIAMPFRSVRVSLSKIIIMLNANNLLKQLHFHSARLTHPLQTTPNGISNCMAYHDWKKWQDHITQQKQLEGYPDELDSIFQTSDRY